MLEDSSLLLPSPYIQGLLLAIFFDHCSVTVGCPSSYLLFPLSHFNSLSLSHRHQWSSCCYLGCRTSLTSTRRQERHRGGKMWGGNFAAFEMRPRRRLIASGEPWLPGVVPPSPAMPTAISRFHEVLFDPTIIMVPFVCDESGWISKHIFRGRLSKLW